MSLIEAWHDALVQLACLGSLELHLIDVSILVANCRWDKARALREALN